MHRYKKKIIRAQYYLFALKYRQHITKAQGEVPRRKVGNKMWLTEINHKSQ